MLLARRLSHEQAAMAGGSVERLMIMLHGAVVGTDGVAGAESAVLEGPADMAGDGSAGGNEAAKRPFRIG